jgi:hypothetical protein
LIYFILILVVVLLFYGISLIVLLFRVGTVAAVSGRLRRGFFRSEGVAVVVVAQFLYGVLDFGAALVELGSDLEAVEQQSGTLGVDPLVDDGVEHLSESNLQTAGVFQGRKLDAVEDSLGSGGAAEVDVVVAKGGLAQGWGFALAPAGHDVAAFVIHGLSYSPVLCKEVMCFLLVTRGVWL